MVIACKCRGCGKIYMQQDDELTLEFDFLYEKITFVCPNCKILNELSFESLRERNKKQPLPPIGIMPVSDHATI